MTQPATTTVNGAPGLLSAENALPVVPGKRKRDSEDDGPGGMDLDREETKVGINGDDAAKEKDLIKPYFEVLSRYVAFSVGCWRDIAGELRLGISSPC